MFNVNRIAAWTALFTVSVAGSVAADDASKPKAENSQWIGVHCVPADAALRAQLELGEGQGLLVQELVAQSPAAKAGIKQYDILLNASQQPLADVPSQSRVVQQGKPFPVELLRGGKKMTLEVT